MQSRAGRAEDKFCPGLRCGMGLGLRVMACSRDLGEGCSHPGRCGRNSPHPSSTCGDFPHCFFHPSFWVCYRIRPIRRLQKQHWEGAGELFSPLKQAKICGHGRPASRAVLKHQGSQAAMTFQGLFTSHSTLLMSNQPKAHYKLKKQKNPTQSSTYCTHSHYSVSAWKAKDHLPHLNASYFSLAALMATVHRGEELASLGSSLP